MAAITVSDLRGRWAAGRPARGVWSRLPGVVTAELLARSGPDYVVFDLQHGALDEGDLPGVTAAVVAAGAGDRDHMQKVISSVIRRALAVGMPVGVHTADGVHAGRYAEQGTTIITAAMDDSVLTDAVQRHLALVRTPEPS